MEESGAVTRSPCLLSNWLEERAAAGLDAPITSSDIIGEGHAHRHGHSGILSTQSQAQLSASTNHHESYQRPTPSHTHRIGQRDEMLHRFLYSKFRQEMLEELSCAAEELKMAESTTQRDYRVEGFRPQTPRPSQNHDYATEQPVTFWTENFQRITGVSDVRSQDTPFKKNSAFTTPTCLSLETSPDT